MTSKNIPADIRSKSIKESKEEINKILLKEKKYIDIDDYSDFKEKMFVLKF